MDDKKNTLNIGTVFPMFLFHVNHNLLHVIIIRTMTRVYVIIMMYVWRDLRNSSQQRLKAHRTVSLNDE